MSPDRVTGTFASHMFREAVTFGTMASAGLYRQVEVAVQEGRQAGRCRREDAMVTAFQVAGNMGKAAPAHAAQLVTAEGSSPPAFTHAALRMSAFYGALHLPSARVLTKSVTRPVGSSH